MMPFRIGIRILPLIRRELGVVVGYLLLCLLSSSSFISALTSSVSLSRIPEEYDNLIPVFNSSREARRSVVSGGLFSLISFDNVPCVGMSGGDIGTCYSARECSNLAGNPNGICAGNFGVCCVVTPTCGGTVTTNNTYFINPDYPNPTSGPLACSLTVNKLAGATELYLEFTDFQIAPPTLGACSNDTFTVTAGTGTMMMIMPVLCGNVAGQMYYIDITSLSGPFTLTFNLGSIKFDRKWKIRIVQFKPGDACAAPSGCQLWFRDPTGTIESFNYDGGKGEMINKYCINICFKLSSGYCSLLLSENEFMLGGMAPNDCTEGDYLLANGQKFCGDSLNNGMLLVNQTMPSYIQIQVCSGKTNPEMNMGFSLNYTEIPCMGSAD